MSFFYFFLRPSQRRVEKEKNHLRRSLIFSVSFKHNENEITFAIKFLIYSSRISSRMGKKCCFLLLVIHKSMDSPQFDRNVVDVSVVGAFERLVEHIESSVVILMPVRLMMGRGRVS